MFLFRGHITNTARTLNERKMRGWLSSTKRCDRLHHINWGLNSQSVKWTTHFHPWRRSRTCGALPPCCLCEFTVCCLHKGAALLLPLWSIVRTKMYILGTVHTCLCYKRGTSCEAVSILQFWSQVRFYLFKLHLQKIFFLQVLWLKFGMNFSSFPCMLHALPILCFMYPYISYLYICVYEQ